MRVFYSWQSDLPNATNRGLIGDALEKAAKEIRNDDSLRIDPVIDRDTLGVGGAPDIGTTIFGKIESATVFVCDVSTINSGQDGRPTPNPNVLIELGYAARALGWSRVILIVNTAYGRVEELPFDLKLKRTLTYESRETDPSRSEPRNKLAAQLGEGLRTILAALPQPEPDLLPFDLAITGVESGTVDRAPRIKKYMSWLVRQLDDRNPISNQDGNFDDSLVAALDTTKDLASDFGKLVDAIGSFESSSDSARSVAKGFEPILQRYVPSPEVRRYRTYDFDFYKFMGHELFVILVAALLRHDRLETLTEVLDQEFILKSAGGQTSRPFHSLSKHLETLRIRKDRLKLPRISLHSDLLKSRRDDGALAESSPHDDFLDGDYFLFLASELSPATPPSQVSLAEAWRPWSLAFFDSAGFRFLAKAQRKKYAARLLPAFKLADVETLRSRFADRWGNFDRMFPTGDLLASLPMNPESLGSRD